MLQKTSLYQCSTISVYKQNEHKYRKAGLLEKPNVPEKVQTSNDNKNAVRQLIFSAIRRTLDKRSDGTSGGKIAQMEITGSRSTTAQV